MKLNKIKALCVSLMSAALIFTTASLSSVDVNAAVLNDLVSASANAAGTYKSELTNEPTSLAVKDQRPIAVMVDNEKTALKHFGVNQADIVYEMVNSTLNGRITRLMCVYKNWQNITQFGSVRSARPTNFMLAAEYNAILIHDGGPYYNNQYIKQPYTNNLSGGFARFSNGKSSEFTEYVTYNGYTNPKTKKSYAGLASRIKSAGYSSNYNSQSIYKSAPHFNFSDANITLDAKAGVKSATEVKLPFPHNSSKLLYNAATGTYDYYEYNAAHIDAIDNKITTFKNVIIMKADLAELDKNGYMVYGILAQNQPGFYLTNGKAIPITWTKLAEVYKTEYNEMSGAPLTINTGKTYIAIVPSDAWAQLSIQ